MNVSWRWLCGVAPGLEALSPDEAVDRLAMRGAPVDRAVDLAKGLDDVVVARVLSAEPHPNADRLTLCRVMGSDGEAPVVCGAPDVQAGACYPFAPVGAVLPGGFKIGRRKIRGQHSEGMLCSERELGLGGDHEGIMLLEGPHEAGAPFVEAMELDDLRLEVEVAPNRGDLLSHTGIARELHPQGHAGISLPEFPGSGSARPLEFSSAPAARAFGGSVAVLVEDPALCSRYVAVVIRGVAVGPSPLWLANRLRAAGARPVNNVVDATNYVMLELGQPLHAFDLARLVGPSISVGPARTGESLVTLDGRRRALEPGMLLIRDADGPVAVAGVMGGSDSQVTLQTTDVVLECAHFEPKRVRSARRALGMSTDASYRFERGVDPASTELAAARAAALIQAVAGGRVDAVADACPSPWKPPVVALRPSRIAKVLGVDFPKDAVVRLLEPLGYELEPEEDAAGALHVRVPGHRARDTLREADLIEEVARTHGYDAFPETLGPFRPGTAPGHPLFDLEDSLRGRLIAEGFSEAHTPALGPAEDGDVALLNPAAATEGFLRRDRLSGLVNHVERNMARGIRDVRLFEIGTAFAPAGAGQPPAESTRVAVVLAGAREPAHWSRPAEPFDVYDAARVLEIVAAEAHPNGRVGPAPRDAPVGPFALRRCFELVDESGEVVGRAGEIAKGRADLPPWAGVLLGAEATLPEQPPERPQAMARDLPDQPASQRDVAFFVPADVSAGRVLEATKAGGGRWVEHAEVFDVYEGDDVPAGMRSVAVRLRFRSRSRTLTDEEVERAFRRAVARAKEETGVQPRS